VFDLTAPETHAWLVLVQAALGVVTLVATTLITAPYGRHERPGWGPTLPARAGWILMESPAVLVFGAVFAWFGGTGPASWALLLIWMAHYVHRAFVYPFRMRWTGRRMPVLVPMLAIGFNVLNAYVNAAWIGRFGAFETSWLLDARFIVGALVFAAGMAINLRSDATLRALRAPGETGYRVPQGGLYRFVSCPNYLGELVEWVGWTIATWSSAGAVFAFYTAANLAPRAMSNHRWYLDRFPDYPRERRALIPWVW
jgi:3-oxo-5-alpha-steroid 4-dehydrogenase 1